MNIDANRKTLSFGEAIDLVHKGFSLTRKAWYKDRTIYKGAEGEIFERTQNAYWTPTQDDMVAKDWYIEKESNPADGSFETTMQIRAYLSEYACLLNSLSDSLPANSTDLSERAEEVLNFLKTMGEK